MSLYTFGDSFIESPERILRENNYIAQIQSSLNVTGRHYGVGGSALSYMYYTVEQHIHNFKADDIVIISLTDVKRQWLLEKIPLHGNSGSYLYYSETSAEFKYLTKVFEHYFSTMIIDGKETMYLINFLWALYTRTRHLKVEPIILVCFLNELQLLHRYWYKLPPLKYSISNLFSVSRNEVFQREADKVRFIQADSRYNHLSTINHTVLANKILDFIKGDSECVDLRHDFHENFRSVRELNA